MLQHIFTTTSSSVLHNLTGLSSSEFNLLVESFEKAWHLAEKKRRKKGKCRRKEGGGRKGLLPKIEEKLLFILFYIRHYPVQRLQGIIFGMKKSQANEWILRLLPVIESALGNQSVLPLRCCSTMDDMLKQCPDLIFLIDATERQIQRPKDLTRQKDYYSGKKKCHTVKNTLVVDIDKKILFMGNTTEGKRHDKKLADDDSPPFPPQSKIGGDSGYEGYSPPGTEVFTPIKKPRGRDLEDEDKQINRQLSGIRVKVEHAIGGVKINRIVHDKFRNRKAGLDDSSMLVSVGIYNFKCKVRGKKKVA
jgi:hypothetical protein